MRDEKGMQFESTSVSMSSPLPTPSSARSPATKPAMSQQMPCVHAAPLINQLTEREIEMAYHIWKQGYASVDLDQAVAPFLNENVCAVKIDGIPCDGAGGWMRRARVALRLSSNEMANRLQISRSAYTKLERTESSGAVTIATLARVAAAMECDLVYAIRPKNKMTFSRAVWQKLFATAQTDPWLNVCWQKLRGHALASLSRRREEAPSFRRAQSWSER